MKRFSVIAILLILAACSASIFLISLSSEQAVIAAADIAMQPDSATDIIMRSRETAQRRTASTWYGAGLLALALVALGSIAFVMRGGTDLLKQWRLARKRPSAPQPRPFLPELPMPPYQEIPTARRPLPVPQLPTWSESHEEYNHS